MMLEDFSASRETQIDLLRSYCLALYLILDAKNLVEDGEFQKYFNQATHLIEQREAQAKEEALANMDEKERRIYDVFSQLFGQE